MSVSSISNASSSAAWQASGRAGVGRLSPEEQRVVDKLSQRDKEVRAHEQAHLSAAGGLATSGASYTYQTGPDGRRYAVGGEVGINVSPGRTPEDTLARAQQIQAAALAPADPSGADRQIAAQAARMAATARIEMARQGSSGATGVATSAAEGSGAESGASTAAAASSRAEAYQRIGGMQSPAGGGIDTYA
ncbi:putative metalloprotease CJM1_0395 family protein [Zoogloea sp.]|uniref:putative metalloprotease CJM1_0395 family protein n=1 Tax=Zoogloea sp. TaxID=49181 RepID=UPI001416BF90|nr:MAG: catalase [Zoogloea sp.]